MNKNADINKIFDVPCPLCGHSESMLTEKREDGKWYMCMNQSNNCGLFFVHDLTVINDVLEMMLKSATCTKKAIGAVVEKGGVLSGGFNGPPRGFEKYCQPCPRLNSPSGTDMDKCPAVHAEMSAILKSHKDVRGGILYITCGLPCKDCMKEIIESGIVKIVSPYPLNTQDTEDRGNGYKSGESYNFNLSYEMMKAAGIEYKHENRLVKGDTAHVYIKGE